MSDPCQLIAQAQVAAVNAAVAAGQFALTFQASSPEDPKGEIESESLDLRVLFFPYGETEEKIGRGGQVLEIFTTSLLVSRRLDETVKQDKMLSFVRALRASFRGVKMAGYRYVDSEIVSKFDVNKMHERNHFLSVVRFSYMGTG